MAAKWQWDDVQVFLAASRERTLSGAARVLGIDHVTVGRRIAALERQLGAKLLNRTPDGLVTTNAGAAIVGQCEAMVTAAESLERLVAGQDTRAAGVIRLTATEALTHKFLVPLLAELNESHPEIQFELTTGIRKLDIARREADIALRVSVTRPGDSGLICRKVGDIGFTLYASNKYLSKVGRPERGHGLGGYDLVTYLGQTWPRSMGQLFMGESTAGARFTLRSNDQFALLRATAAGCGISELPCYYGDECAEIVRVWPEEEPALRTAWLVTHEDLRRATRIRVVSSAIADVFRRHAKTLRNGRRGLASRPERITVPGQ